MPISCITCGGGVPDDSEFCPSCGRAVQLVDPAPRAPQASAPAAAVRSEYQAPAARLQAAAPPAIRSHAPEKPTAQRKPEPSVDEDDPAPPPGPPVIWNDRLFAAASYCTFIPAVALLFIQPYARRKFVRFHSLQSVLFWVLVAVLIGVGVLASTFGFLLLWLFTGALVMVGLALTWLVLAIKALQGEWFQLPGLGYLAEQYAGVR